MTRTLGVVLAGGGSRRFGSPKAGAELNGLSLMDHSLGHLKAAGVDRIGIVASHTGSVPGWDPDSSVEVRRDGSPDLGPLEGLRVGLAWARELDMTGVLVLPVDLPLVSPDLLRHLLLEGEREGEGGVPRGAVVPESDGPRGYEPLCAWYSPDILDGVEAAMKEGAHAPAHVLERVAVHRVPLEVVARFGDPAVQFLNSDIVDRKSPKPQPPKPYLQLVYLNSYYLHNNKFL